MPAASKHVRPSVVKKGRSRFPLCKQVPITNTSCVFYGSDCSGLDGGAIALGRLVKFDHLFGSESDPSYAQVFRASHPDCKILFNDCTQPRGLLGAVEPMKKIAREGKKTIYVYTSGWPCQPYSNAGQRQGIQDLRGKVIWGVLESIAETMPDIFVLENVKNVATDQKYKDLWEDVLQVIGSIHSGIYFVEWKILNSHEYGAVPAARERLYLVGVRKDKMVRPWNWPNPVKPPSLDSILQSRQPGDCISLDKLPTGALQHILKAMQIVEEKGSNWKTDPWVVDIMSSQKFGTHVTHNKMPTITKSHAAGLWLLHRQDKVRLEEVLAAQGIRQDDVVFPASVKKTKAFEMVGNGFTATVFERLLKNLLPAVGCVV